LSSDTSLIRVCLLYSCNERRHDDVNWSHFLPQIPMSTNLRTTGLIYQNILIMKWN